MKTKSLFAIILLALFIANVKAQDTFSIVAVDSITGEVGSAGASCVDMDNFPGYQDDFLGELFPGVGAINTQAWYLASNQANARNRMNMGETPSQIINWLINNDAQSQPQKRQYGIVAIVDGSPESAAHTGTSTDDYKNHIAGPNYSIQGNILLGQIVLDSMEHRFLSAEGDLACKLMDALQGAKMVGADSRCHSNGTSSLFSFVKVAQSDDTFGNPSFILSVRTHDNAGIEPIDSLQTLFDEVHECGTVGVNENKDFNSRFLVYPNPINNYVKIKNKTSENYIVELQQVDGKVILKKELNQKTEFETSSLSSGIYILHFYNKQNSFVKKIIKK